ncbi:PQQ-binding-like beta-propeller repeat protein [Halorussus sp. MSC15.2]|uniref:outer membrane protein assembly factor BamB family protein n=1 Tax=Halorussus sp. MSC15.2 TaxID=2283638 RepID=UPI0013D3A200|nr:PQQ-binding-like beta-propeller repeat protein [Halorussus sp. MSC15.2]NEU57081.1 PQQ-binding-like beta-propeller repeat protein [Halorussus sp. MSC15.2]
MPDWTRSQVLATLGTAAVGVGGYWWFEGDHCIDRRDPRWTLEGRRWSPPATDEHSVYVSEGHGLTSGERVSRVASLKQSDGEPNWVFTVTGGGAGVPLVTDERVYVGTGADYVYSLDKRTGHVEWRYDAGGRETYGGGAWGQPAKANGLVIVGASYSGESDPDPSNSDAFTHRVAALDADTGEEVWAGTVGATVWTGPVAVGDTVVAATEAGVVYGFAVGDGSRRWRTAVGEKIWEPIFGGNGAVHVASGDGTVAAIDSESGAKRWTTSLSGEANGENERKIRATERDDETFFVGTDSGRVIAFPRSGGPEDWRFEGEAAIADISSDGSLAYVLDQRGYVSVLDAASGERRDRFRVAEKSWENKCGWSPKYERAAGLAAGEYSLTVTGSWVGQVPRHRA